MRVPLIDPVKALAAQVIVLHHMMFYSSMRGPLEDAFPAIVGFFADPARYAVQVFLVMGGFLTMQSLLRRTSGTATDTPQTMGIKEWSRGIAARYRRLTRPYALALLLACVTLAWVQRIDPVVELTPADPFQLLAHLFLLHDLLDIPALSAGVWYVAVDFQLYALSLTLLALALRLSGGQTGKARSLLLLLVSGLTLASLLLFNRHGDLDPYGLFFYGSYGLGMLGAWAVQARREWHYLLVASAVVLIAQVLEYRERLWVTLATTAFLLWAPRVQQLPAWMQGTLGRFAQQSSYALFLVHYPMAIALFAIIDRLFLTGVTENLMALSICWLLFMGGAWVLMRAEMRVFDDAWPTLRQTSINGMHHVLRFLRVARAPSMVQR